MLKNYKNTRVFSEVADHEFEVYIFKIQDSEMTESLAIMCLIFMR